MNKESNKIVLGLLGSLLVTAAISLIFIFTALGHKVEEDKSDNYYDSLYDDDYDDEDDYDYEGYEETPEPIEDDWSWDDEEVVEEADWEDDWDWEEETSDWDETDEDYDFDW